MKEGTIVKSKYNKEGNVVYTIKTEDNEIIDSVEYLESDKILKTNENISFNIIEGKAQILNKEIICAEKKDKKEYLTIFLILAIISILTILYLFNVISKSLIFVIIVLLLLVLGVGGFIKIYTIFKKGKIEEVIVIDKEQVDSGLDVHTRPRMRYYYNLTIKLNNGIEITDTIPFSAKNKNIKIGDKIKVKVYNNKFILVD